MKIAADFLKREWLYLLFLVLTISAAAGEAPADSVEAYHYQETVGERRTPISWCLVTSDQNRLIYRTPDEINLTETDGALNTRRWIVRRKEAGTDLEAVRKGDTITINGRFDQKQVAKTVTIDTAPWFQSTSLSMRRFVRNGLNELYFWTIRPDTLKAYKLVAERKGVEDIQVNGNSETAVMVELRLTGILSAFWKSTYWFRQRDGLFLKFEGPSGPPGDPPMSVEFQGAAAPCDPSVIAALSHQRDDGARDAGCQTGN